MGEGLSAEVLTNCWEMEIRWTSAMQQEGKAVDGDPPSERAAAEEELWVQWRSSTNTSTCSKERGTWDPRNEDRTQERGPGESRMNGMEQAQSAAGPGGNKRMEHSTWEGSRKKTQRDRLRQYISRLVGWVHRSQCASSYSSMTGSEIMPKIDQIKKTNHIILKYTVRHRTNSKNGQDFFLWGVGLR